MLALPSDAARHAQVRRVQPGDVVQVFDGRGLAFGAVVQTMGRRGVTVRLTERVPEPQAMGCELPLAVKPEGTNDWSSEPSELRRTMLGVVAIASEGAVLERLSVAATSTLPSD